MKDSLRFLAARKAASLPNHNLPNSFIYDLLRGLDRFELANVMTISQNQEFRSIAKELHDGNYRAAANTFQTISSMRELSERWSQFPVIRTLYHNNYVSYLREMTASNN